MSKNISTKQFQIMSRWPVMAFIYDIFARSPPKGSLNIAATVLLYQHSHHFMQ